jgi:hypothetical protein
MTWIEGLEKKRRRIMSQRESEDCELIASEGLLTKKKVMMMM